MSKKRLFQVAVVFFFMLVLTISAFQGTYNKKEATPKIKVFTQEKEVLEVLELLAYEHTVKVASGGCVVDLPLHYCRWLEEEISQVDYELMCRTTWCESGNQDLQTQTMVCLTILNRYASGDYESIHDVVYSKNAYSVTQWEGFEKYGWTEQVQQAVDIALNENNHPRDMYYFRTLHYHTFGTPYMVSDDLWFSTN